jgi:hypothetical protein
MLSFYILLPLQLLLYNVFAIKNHNFHYLILDSTIIRVETYLSVQSVLHHPSSPKISFWYNEYKPVGDFWNALKDRVELVDISSLGNLINFDKEHLKLKILYLHGGIFLDPSMIMLEHFDSSIFEENEVVIEAGCNKVLGARANSSIISRLLDKVKKMGMLSTSPLIPGQLSMEAGVQILKNEEFCWPGTLKNYESLFTNRFYGDKFGFNSRHMFINLIPGNVFTKRIELDTINQVNNPIFCLLRVYSQANYDLEKDPGCHNPRREIDNVHPDGTGIPFLFNKKVALYEFGDDSASPSFHDSLANNLHGFSFGLERQKEYAYGVYRNFPGTPDALAVIPLGVKSITARELTIGFKFRPPKWCRSSKVMACLKLEDGSEISILYDCVERIGEEFSIPEVRVVSSRKDFNSILEYLSTSYISIY